MKAVTEAGDREKGTMKCPTMNGRPSAIERIMNGVTWADFCDALKRAGDIIAP